MVAWLRKKTETAAIREPSTSRNISGEVLMVAERVDCRALVQHDRLLPDRKLRNRIILGNAVAWIAIAVLIRLLFF
jgi:mRNA-degrading endonuclease toxin of MazEF toxin-antitoxin module